jgi:D-sedoheptulose 7-phosphate isomerase
MSFVSNYISVDNIEPEKIEKIIEILTEVRESGNQIFVCGNGGSATTASHMANDLGKGASLQGSNPFKIISLTDNISWITALANDINYESIFANQLKNFAQPNDVLIAISGSGNSPNIVKAVEFAQSAKMKTIGWTGFDGGKISDMVDLSIIVKSTHMGRVEDLHVIMMHMVCYYFIEEKK